jgi:MFS family permease
MNFHGTNPNTVDYYLGYILVLSIGYSVIMLIQNFLKNRNEELGKMNITLDFYGAKFGSQVVHDSMTREQKDVRFKYLIVSMLVKSATWIKAPYMFALYNRIHGFTRTEIGYLLALDNFAAFFLGPILSGLADVYGRKKFCVLYCISIIVHVSLRVTGSRSLAVVAQIVTGISACLLDNVFESWLNFEANFLFPGLEEETAKKMKNSYLREIFTKQVTLDCFCSIVLTGVATILYAYYGILYPFYASIVLSFIAGLVIALWWQENNMSKLYLEENTIHNYTFFERTLYAWNKLKNDKALLSVGIIDSCFKISLILFLFIWTPLLEGTIGTTIHPGAIFVCFMLCRLIGSELFEVNYFITF